MLKIDKEAIRTITIHGYDITIERHDASDEPEEDLTKFGFAPAGPTPYDGMTRLHAESTSYPLAAQYLFRSSKFMNTVTNEDIDAFVASIETLAAEQAEEANSRLATMHPDERRLEELMVRQSEWGVGTREAYEAGCAFAGVEAHSDDAILRGSYGVRYADYYMSQYGDRRWKLIMGQRLASARLNAIEKPEELDPIDDLLYGGMDDVSLLSRDLRADPYGEER